MIDPTGNIGFSRRNLSDADKARIEADFAAARQAEADHQAKRPQILAEGEAALRRLLPIAQGHSGQCRYVAGFLLSLYNGTRFKFDLTDLRCIDRAIFKDCITVLQMDAEAYREVHTYFPKGGDQFEALAVQWRIPDRLQLREVVKESTLPKDVYYDRLRMVRDEYVASEVP